MDVSTPLIFVGLFIVASLSLFLVYKFGIKEKSYEEAIAEQRQQTSALLGIKTKPKDKKNKKAAKKSKEKPQLSETENVEKEKEEGKSESSPSHKLHVEFKEVIEEVPIEKETSFSQNKKHIKKEKARPILINKEKINEKVVSEHITEVPIVNHFEEIHPKDEFELLRSSSKDELLKQEPVKEVVATAIKQFEAEQPVKPQQRKPAAKQTLVVGLTLPIQEKETEDKSVENATVPQTNGITTNTGKEKKKKKSEYNALQQLTAERDGLLNLVRKAELSRSEVQILIDLLLNKQHEAPEIIDEWSEGKSDPVQKLKKQLAEKEKSLIEQQDALIGAQAKLKEIRNEQHADRIKLQQKIRDLEEMLQAKQLEIQANNNRLQSQTQKMQQMQSQINDDLVKLHKTQEENNAFRMQLQQCDIRLAQAQEAEVLINKLGTESQELQNHNQQLLMELQRLRDETSESQQAYMNQLNNAQFNIDQLTKTNRELTDVKNDAERKLDIFVRQENDLNIEISHLKTECQQQMEEKRRLEHALEQMRNEVKKVENHRDETLNTIAQLKAEMQKLHDEKSQILNKQINGAAEETKAYKVELLNLTNELASVKKELQQAKQKIADDLEVSNSRCQKFQSELEEQKSKNNELRTRNWKVMEALTAAENKIKTSSKQSECDIDKLSNEIRASEQEAQKQFLLRLFPEIDAFKNLSSENWQEECGKVIKSYITILQESPQVKKVSSPENTADVTKLQAQILHYKNIIDDTEGMLNNLQSHIEREEITWRSRIAAKDAEIELLKEEQTTQLNIRVASLQDELTSERGKMQRLVTDHQQLQNTLSDSNSTVDKLSEELGCLKEQLRLEQSKDRDVSLKAQNYNSNSTNGPPVVENLLSSSSSIASSLAEVTQKKSKCKKKKKKVL